MAGPVENFADTPQMPTGVEGAPEETISLDIAIKFVTEFNENTAIYAKIANMLMGLQLETLLVGYECKSSNQAGYDSKRACDIKSPEHGANAYRFSSILAQT